MNRFKVIPFALSMLPLLAVLPAESIPIGVQVPTIINLYSNSGTTEQEARDAIKEANKALKQAGFKLVPVAVNQIGANSGGTNFHGGDNGAGGGTAGDGDLTVQEGTNAQTFGGQEVRKLPNKRGIKLSFTRTPEVGSTTPGWSVHRDPTVVVKKRANTQQTGETIAHELGHVLTLGPSHVITPGFFFDDKADAGGHAPNKAGNTGNGNLMAPSNRRNGTQLTNAQINEMQKNRYTFGKCATQFSGAFPAIKDAEQFGAATDRRNDQSGASLYDLNQVVLTGLDATADRTGGDVQNINAQITVNGILPSSGQIDLVYALGFDGDANTSTGVTYGGNNGIDRIVYTTATGDIGLGNFTLTASVLDPVSGTMTLLPELPIAESDHQFFDSEDNAVPVATSFLLNIPKSMLNLSVTEIPVVAVSGLVGSFSDFSDDSFFDTITDLLFDSDIFLDDPTLSTFGNGVPIPGQPYEFSISGLTPNDSFNLFLDDELVFSGLLDNAGSFTDSFIFPSNLSNFDYYFLTAQDSTGEFAYSITCPVPEPSTLFLLGVGLAGLVTFGRNRLKK